MELQQEDVPLLQSFHYSIGTDVHDCSPSESLNFWKTCKFLAGPNLRRFCADSCRPPFKLLSFPIKWQTLTHIEFSMGEQGQMVDTVSVENMLRQCLCLISLKLALRSDGSHNMDDIELPALEILKIQEFGTVSNIPGILAVIIAPSLKTLTYNVDRTVDTNPGNLVTMLKRTPNLKQLILGFCNSHNLLLECIQHCPLLSYFQLSGRGFFPPTSFDLFISAFILADDCLCPHMDHFRCSSPIFVSPETCHNIINRKKGAIPHLKRWKVLNLCITYEACNEEDYSKLRSEILADGWEAIDIHFIPSRQISPKLTNEIGRQVYFDRQGALWPNQYMWPARDMWPLEE